MNLPLQMPALNKEQRAHQNTLDLWNIFAGFAIGAIPAFIFGFEIGNW